MKKSLFLLLLTLLFSCEGEEPFIDETNPFDSWALILKNEYGSEIYFQMVYTEVESSSCLYWADTILFDNSVRYDSLNLAVNSEDNYLITCWSTESPNQLVYSEELSPEGDEQGFFITVRPSSEDGEIFNSEENNETLSGCKKQN